jgi:hypothetical protein
MKMEWMKRWTGICSVLLLLAQVTGCEDAETGSALSVTPSEAGLTGVGATSYFTAAARVEAGEATNRNEEIIYPLVWSVSNPALGGMMSSAGDSAVYESNGKKGQNVVFVKDQFGREGLAVINQR